MIVARLGGDEFGIIVKDELTSEALMDFGRTLCNGLSVPYDISTIATEVSASAGFVIYPEGGQTVEMLMEHADYALYHAKSAQRGAPVIFSHRDVTEMHTLTLVDQRLRLADLESELWLAYQPIVDLRYGATTGFEALARWTSPTAGSIPPDIFIRAAERSEMVNRITELLFRRALREARTWPQPLGISFNLSARNIATDETMLRLIAIINESGIDASRIDLEITESVLMADFENAVQKLQALRNLGVKISLDDFGTGYSSLSYVHRLQFDKIKIDRGFIAGIEADPKSVNVIRTVVDLCRNLNLTSVVEGVETAEQVRIVSDLQCDLMQGYYAGRPMPAKEICSFLEVERRRLARPHLARSA